MNIGIYIYDNVEVLDFAGPYEVFTTASRLSHSQQMFSIFLVGGRKTVTARGGLQVISHYAISDHPEMDVLVIPGGVHYEEMKNPEVLQWIKLQNERVSIISSVCTGAFLLAAAGVVSNQKVTTHWEDIEELKEQFPGLQVEEKKRSVRDGRLFTSGGISAGIDMSLSLVAHLAGRKLALKTARQMEYRWDDNL